MRRLVKDFVEIASETVPIIEPIYEFGSLQVPGQENFADLRQFFRGKEYVGCDMAEGPGVDRIINLHNIALPSETVGTALIVDTLEHVEFFREAMNEVYRILKPDGIAIISSVMNFRIHNYPYDYWRFTPDGFKSILKIFPSFFVDFVGEENFPHTVVGIAFKSTVNDSIFTDEFKRRIDIWEKVYTNPAPGKKGWRHFMKLFIPPIILDMYRKVKDFPTLLKTRMS